MKIGNHILVIISILSLLLVISIQGNDSSPSDDIYDEVKKAFGQKFKEAKEKFGPVSSLDLDQFKDAKDAFGPIPSFDEDTDDDDDDDDSALGPTSSSTFKKAKEALGPISPSTLDKAKEALGRISPSTIDEAKKALGPVSSKAKEAPGPASSGVIDKARKKLDSLASWITQSKVETPFKFPNEREPEDVDEDEDDPTKNTPESSNVDQAGLIRKRSPFDPYGVLAGAKQRFNSLMADITQEKEQISPSLVEEVQKESSPDITQVKEQTSPSDVDAPSPSSAPVSSERSELSKIIDKAKSLFNPNKEETLSVSPSISVKSSSEDESAQNKLQISPASDVKLHSTSVYLDHDDALAVESMIKQAQSNAQLAMDEAKTLVSDPTINPSSDTGKCVQKCMANYESCNQKLNKAMEDLKTRKVESLKGDIGEVEREIQACQKCFLANTKMQFMFKDLEEATIKATRECLNVLDHSG